MALVDDLKAAKALIDTPEKWVTIGDVGAIDKVCGHGTVANRFAFIALDEALADRSRVLTHADMMNLFDAAIKRAEQAIPA